MTTSEVSQFLQQALWASVLVGGPIVIGTMLVGLVISIFQAATQINEATLTFVPKLIVVAAILVIGGPWMLGQLATFTRVVFHTMETVAR
jgi:flagellar biosynthesis protein FliQ